MGCCWGRRRDSRVRGGELGGWGVFDYDGKVFDSPDFFANVMDLVDGDDAAVAGGGDGVSLDCILEVTFSGGSAPFRPRAELQAADMLALHLTPKVRTKHSDHCRHVRTVRLHRIECLNSTNISVLYKCR
ncbi:hypothetical protein MTP99_003066 [Tenebrio molitor]|nr:hypothetical protein MTP99_003066 [Tenebrio molitor]